MIKKHIIGETAWYFLGELIAKATPFLLLPYLTRKLTSDGFGALSYQLAIMSFLALFISMGQEAATLSYYYKKGKHALPYLVVASVLINSSISLVAALAACLINLDYLIIVLLASFSVFYQFQLTLFQAQKKVKQYVILQSSYSLLFISLTFLLLQTQSSHLLQWRLLAQLLAFAMVLVPLFMVFSGSIKRIQFNNLKRYILYILAYGLPLFPHQISLVVRGQFDRILINAHYSTHELGVYSAAVQLATVMTVLLMILNKALLPYYYQALKNQTLSIKQIKKYTLISVPIMLFITLLSIMLPEKIYLLLLGNDYAGIQYYISCYLLGFGLTAPYLLLVNHYFYHGHNLVISKITFFATTIYVILLIIFGKTDIHYIPFALIFSQIITLLLLWKNLSYPTNQAA